MKNNPVKKTKTVKSKKNTCPKCTESLINGLFVGRLLGFTAGALIIAVFDYFDKKHNKISRIKRGSDAD